MPKQHPAAKPRNRLRHLKARLRHAAFTKAPLMLTGGRLARNASMMRLVTVRHDIVLPRLPAALRGLRIAHISDLHTGDLLPPDRLPAIVDAVHALKPDLIAVTGDVVDLSLGVLPAVVAALRRLKAPLGAFHVMGNHDHLEDGGAVIDAFREAGLDMLVNRHQVIEARGARITLAGIDWAERRRELHRLVHGTLRQAGGDDLRLLLAHHPNAFPFAQRQDVDLTLSGHTHGGQLKLANTRTPRGSIGLGALAHRYPHGLYRADDRFLHVTAGIGSWFPLRVRCPAEIALLTLLPGGVGPAGKK